MASTNVTNGGGTKTKDRLTPSTRKPPSNVTVKKSTGSTMKSMSAWFLERLVGDMVGCWFVSGQWSLLVVSRQLSNLCLSIAEIGNWQSPIGNQQCSSFSCAQDFQRVDV